MKKFLTVLLALSVVFTYTVGTAFAAEPTYAQKVVQAKQSVMDTLDTNYNNMVKTLADKAVSVGGGTFTISKEAWTKVAGDLKTDKEEAIDLAAKELAADTANENKSVIELTGMIAADVDVTVDGLFTELSTEKADTDDYVDAAGRYQVGIDKDAYLAKAATVDLSVYSTTTPADAEEKYYDQAKKAYDAAVKAINDAAAVAANADLATSRTAAIAVKDAFNAAFTETAADSGIYKLNSNIPTISDEAADATTLEAKKAALNSKVAAEAAAYMARCADAAKNDPNYDMEAKKEQKDAYVAIHTYRINALTKLTDADNYFSRINPVEGATSAVYEAKAVAELEKFAEKYKAEKDASGNTIRDAETVDEIVAKATTDIYANMGATSQTVDKIVKDAQDKIVANKVDTLSNDTVGLAKAALEAKREAALAGYYDLEQKTVNAKYDDLIAKIDAAKTDKEVAKVAKDADLTGILTKGQVEALYTGSGACASEFGKLIGKLDAYAGYLEKLDPKKNFSNYKEAYWKAFCIDNDARTGAEVAALYEKAKAVLDGVKNSDDLKAERKAVEAKIDALPSTIALADKAAVEDAKAALDAYMENNNLTTCDVVNEYVLDSAIDDLYEAEKKEVADAVKKLPAKITAADKDALKDIVAKVDAINEQIGDGLLYEGKAEQTVPASVTTALDNIKKAEAKAIKDAVDALPLNITTADADAIKAARELYDAYVAEYTDYANGKVPANQELASVGNDLFKAEAALKVAEDEANAEEITAIKGTHMKIYSSAKKGYIKISWKKSNSEVALDGVEVYRSTKKASGFKKISTFKKQTAKKYTKNMKKGTKYYFYVKGYKMVGNEKVYTHNSIKVARTFRK